ncbi:MAG: alkaline phosphatase [Verrucomicrobiota bacterium]
MSNHSKASRRDFIKLSGLAGAGVVASQGIARQTGKSEGPPRNLIFLVVDGMGTGTLSLAQAYKQRMLSRSLAWFDLYEKGGCARSFQDTASANSPVTDSAAAGSAWGCGQRINNGAVNVTPNGLRPKPLFLLAKEAGKATGLVSTCRITHATPASFVANVKNRDLENEIADQYLERELDVYLGGGLRHFEREDANLLDGFRAKGYAVATDEPSLKKAEKASKLVGLFSDSHIPYAIDRQYGEAGKDVPSLESMFESALEVVSRNPKGFVLQVEAGRVDHAGHNNDPAAIVHEQLEFDRCIPIAEAFLEKNPDTLLVVTTDHGTGGCQLNGVGSRYLGTNEALKNLSEVNGSFESLHGHFKETGEFDAAGFTRITGISVSEEQAQQVVERVSEFGGYFSSAVASVFARELLESTGVGFSSFNHTSEHVEFLTLGPGREAFPPFIYNYQVNGILRDLLEI